MFRKDQSFAAVFEKASAYVPGTEANAVKDFLEKSVEFKKLAEVAATLRLDPDQARSINYLMSKVRNASSFNQILEALERYDTNNTNDPSVKKLGRFGLNTILFFSGYVNNEANFAYYALHLREKATAKMMELGYASETSQLR